MEPQGRSISLCYQGLICMTMIDLVKGWLKTIQVYYLDIEVIKSDNTE